MPEIGSGLTVPRLGLGTAPIADLYHTISDTQAIETVEFALENGVNFLDTAPHYGVGLAEERLGLALRGVPREQYILETKIGRLITADKQRVYDYSPAGIQQSLDASLARLQVDYVDSLLIHDPDLYFEDFNDMITLALPKMLELRETGVVKAIGLGVNTVEILSATSHLPFDCFMLAGRYTLLEHDISSQLDAFKARGISMLLAGVYNSGILATGVRVLAQAHYNYARPPQAIIEKVAQIEAICDRFGVSLPALALQFAEAHPATTMLVVGAESRDQLEKTLAWHSEIIPPELWQTLRDEGMIAFDVPIPL